MKASSIIAVVGALVLIGLSVWLLQKSDEGLTPPTGSAPVPGSAQGAVPPTGSAPRASAGSTGSSATPPGSDGRPTAAPPGSPSSSSTREPASQAAVAPSPAGGSVEPEADRASASAGASAAAGKSSDPRIVEALDTARQNPREEERLSALRWLGENAGPQQFEALQDIQINDPSPEVRRAAELAVNTVRERHANSEWPGVPRGANPQDYMRNVPAPP